MVENSWLLPKNATNYQLTKLGNMVKFYVPTWSLFAGPVTYYTGLIVFPYVILNYFNPTLVLTFDSFRRT